MTASQGVGRGGKREGAGRKSKQELAEMQENAALLALKDTADLLAVARDRSRRPALRMVAAARLEMACVSALETLLEIPFTEVQAIVAETSDEIRGGRAAVATESDMPQ